MQLSDIKILNERFQYSDPETIVKFFIEHLEDKIALASSLGAEDQMLTHIVSNINKETRIFTLDTGRLFPETYDLIDRTQKRYKHRIEVFFPNHEKVEEMVNKNGINLFYDSVENRKMCCQIRKIEPLKRAFKGLKAWICGLRADQSVTRQQIDIVEWDEANKLIKINPLARWSEEQVWEYIKVNKIPYNPLHDKSYPSIGCLPCTRAIMDGEDVRAGRWWWESANTKECGLHKK